MNPNIDPQSSLGPLARALFISPHHLHRGGAASRPQSVGTRAKPGVMAGAADALTVRPLAYAAWLALIGIGIPAGQSWGADFSFKSPNTYQAQENNHYCGAASAQMILDATSVNIMPLPTQDNLYTTARNNLDPNVGPLREGIDLFGLRAAVAANDAAHNYVAYTIDNFDAATRTLAYNIVHYNVPGAFGSNGNGHWVDAYGVKTSAEPVAPAATADFKVNSIYVKDPWSGFFSGLTAAQKAAVGGHPGLGTDAELFNTADGRGLWNRTFLRDRAPIKDPTKPAPAYVGKYIFVTDPDEDVQTDPSAPTLSNSITLDMTTALSEAMTEITSDNGEGGDSTLSTLAAFENGSFSSLGETQLADPLGGSDFLVPYVQSNNAVTGALLLDGSTGGVLGAFWDDSLNGLNLSELQDLVAQPTAVDDNYILAVPEPATSLYGLALCGAIGLNRRRNS